MSGVRLYRALLVLYPRRFRMEYGEDMVQLVTDQLRDESAVRVFARSLLDLAMSVPTRHLETHMKRPNPAIVPVAFGTVSVAGLLFALILGFNGGSVFALVGAVLAAVIAFASARNVEFVGYGGVAAQWWKFLVVGAGGLGALVTAATLTGEVADGVWYVYMSVLLLSAVAIAFGAVLGLTRLAGRTARRANA